MVSASNGFEAKLSDVGNMLLHPPSSADELLPLLEVTLSLYISIYVGGTINFCVRACRPPLWTTRERVFLSFFEMGRTLFCEEAA